MALGLRKAGDEALRVALIGVAAACLATLLAPLGWPFELFAHFRWQLGVAALALLLASLFARRPWMIVLATAALLSQLLPGVMPFGRAAVAAAGTACSGPALRIVTANVLFTNVDTVPLLDWLQHEAPDVVALQEVTPEWAAALERLGPQLPYRVLRPRADPYGIAVLSRWPIASYAEVDLADDGLPSLLVTLAPHGRPLQVLAVHTRWPVTPELQVARDRALQAAAALAQSQAASTVLLGDLNLTPYAPAYARLVAESGLRDARADQSWRPTWQAGFWPLALPIDHVLVPRGSCVEEQGVGPDMGSDHRPLVVDLRLP